MTCTVLQTDHTRLKTVSYSNWQFSYKKYVKTEIELNFVSVHIDIYSGVFFSIKLLRK